MVRRALVSGASIAGLTTAFWLARSGWAVDVVERSATFRDGGQNVDIRGSAHDVIARMGLTDQVRAENTTEKGTVFLGAHGRPLGRIPADREQDGPTAELEILRGDLARIIRDASPDAVDIRYGDEIAGVRNLAGEVEVDLESGRSDRYDILVVAEGVRSRTRDLVFGESVVTRPVGLTIAYGTIPRTAADDDWWRWYSATGRRGITLRPDNVGTIRATLAYVDRENDLGTLSIDDAKRSLVRRFRGAGWEADRIASGFLDSDDVYVDDLEQVVMPIWSRGRVVLTGDAAWCVTPLGGGGTSLALIGGYVLAAYLSRPSADGVGLLGEYERWMRPLIDGAQRLPRGTPEAFYPSSRPALALSRLSQRVLASPPFRSVLARRSHVARTDQELPDPTSPQRA